MRDPDPYAHSLAFIEVRTVSDPRAMVTVDIGASVLRIAGSPRSLERIAANVARLANAEPIASPVRQHVHLDWYPDHPFLAEGT
ncbi:MAG: Imm32 family immunity protein, partial [Aquihabitans sp.]